MAAPIDHRSERQSAYAIDAVKQCERSLATARAALARSEARVKGASDQLVKVTLTLAHITWWQAGHPGPPPR